MAQEHVDGRAHRLREDEARRDAHLAAGTEAIEHLHLVGRRALRVAALVPHQHGLLLAAPIHLAADGERRARLQVEVAIERTHLLGVLGHVGEHGPHEVIGRLDPRLERRVRVRLAQHRHAAARTDVVGEVARQVLEGLEARRRRLLIEVAVVEQLEPVLLAHRLAHVGQQAVAHPLARVGRRQRHERRRVRERVAVIAAVGRVQVHRQVGVPWHEHVLEQRLELAALGLHAVAVQVEALGVRAHAHLLRAVLAAAVLGDRTEAIVAVGVVVRHDEQHDLAQQLVVPGQGQVAQHHERSLLALHLARVDVRLDVDHRPAEPPRLLRRGDHRLARDHERQRASLGRGADRLDRDRRARSLQLVEEREHLGVRRRALVGVCFRNGLRIAGEREARGEQEGGERQGGLLVSGGRTARVYHPTPARTCARG
ncbi:MAG: hypothetical protein U1E76_27740 [Planctomycetota bacterium]